MIRIIPQIFNYKNKNSAKASSLNFASASPYYQSNKNEDSYENTSLKRKLFSNTLDKKVQPPFLFHPIKLPWIQDKNLMKAVNYLNKLEFAPEDVQHVKSIGAVPPFKNGKDAVKYIEDSHIEIRFAPMQSKNIHAQYDFEDNCIKINELYKDSQNPAEIFAMSEAILHEAGHAKDKDSESSLQEEIDCLALNAMAHRTFKKNYPKVFDDSTSLIVKDGVSVYSELLFDNDDTHQALIQRLKIKYGHLPAGDFKHPPNNIALETKNA